MSTLYNFDNPRIHVHVLSVFVGWPRFDASWHYYRRRHRKRTVMMRWLVGRSLRGPLADPREPTWLGCVQARQRPDRRLGPQLDTELHASRPPLSRIYSYVATTARKPSLKRMAALYYSVVSDKRMRSTRLMRSGAAMLRCGSPVHYPSTAPMCIRSHDYSIT